ncbi:hypothetical protein FLA_0275 [Filimonas lacunae]|nr:hypothetical protein FLA_0275 [Filimonas lacunae]
MYIGEDNIHSTSRHRMEALVRLNHAVTIINPRLAVKKYLTNAILNKLHYSTGYAFLQPVVAKWLTAQLSVLPKPDLIWVNSGELIGRQAALVLKAVGCPMVLYNNDDPTGKRDGNRFKSLLKGLRYYDLCVVRYEKEEAELKKYGAQKVMKVFMSYDEVIHTSPYNSREQVPSQFQSEVAFIGTWIPHENRDLFFKELIEEGVPVSIWGDGWERSAHYESIQSHMRGKSIHNTDYMTAIQGAKICIGLLSKGNRDLHTRRSVEVPYVGGLLCAERTSVHQKMYEEGVEAVFWSNAKECAAICKELLSDDAKRESIRIKGMEKVRRLQVGNEDICTAILKNMGL